MGMTIAVRTGNEAFQVQMVCLDELVPADVALSLGLVFGRFEDTKHSWCRLMSKNSHHLIVA